MAEGTKWLTRENSPVIPYLNSQSLTASTVTLMATHVTLLYSLLYMPVRMKEGMNRE